jgi:hypothetical protein
MKGAPAKAIQELAGHANLTTTMRYRHLSPGAKDAAIRLLDQRPEWEEGRGDVGETKKPAFAGSNDLQQLIVEAPGIEPSARQVENGRKRTQTDGNGRRSAGLNGTMPPFETEA